MLVRTYNYIMSLCNDIIWKYKQEINKINLHSDSFQQCCVIEPNMQVPEYLQITLQKLKNAAVGSDGPENC